MEALKKRVIGEDYTTMNYIHKYKDTPIMILIHIYRHRWVHVVLMEDLRIPNRVLNNKRFAMREVGRPRTRWVDKVGSETRKQGAKAGGIF